MTCSMRSGLVAIVAAALLTVGRGSAQTTGDVSQGIAAPAPAHAAADSDAVALPFSLKVQMGMMGRVLGTEVREGRSNLLLEADVLFLGNRNLRRQRGLALRLVGEDDGSRLGLGYVLRSNPRPGAHEHWQMSAGLMLRGSDNHRTLRLPSAFIAAQYGDDRIISICTALEVIRYRDAIMGYLSTMDEQGWWVREDIIDEEGTEVSWYLGGMLHGWVGLVASIASIVGLAIAFSSDGIM